MSSHWSRNGGPNLATSAAIGVNLAVACVQFAMLDARSVRQYTLCPARVLFFGEYYRVVTSAFLHGGALHLGMNMLATATIGHGLECRLGTARLGLFLVWTTLLAGSIHCGIAWLAGPFYLAQHSLGFSGVIFAMVVSEAWRSNSSRSLFGLVDVPSRFYPLAMLVAMQVAVPNISFLGHLAGLLVGALEYYGVLRPLFPSTARLDAACTRNPLYVAAPAETPHIGSVADSARSIVRLARQFLVFLATFVGLTACAEAARAWWRRRQQQRTRHPSAVNNDDVVEKPPLVDPESGEGESVAI